MTCLIDKIREKLKENRSELIATWCIQRYKTGMPYFTFSTPESIFATLDYLQERLTKNKAVNSTEDFLFESRGHQIGNTTIILYFEKLNDEVFKDRKNGKNGFFTSHKMRKFFKSTLQKHNITGPYQEWMIGHSTKNLRDTYTKGDIPTVRMEYREKALEPLSIENVQVGRMENDELKEMKNRLAEN